jgi:sortase (surface protein transpeptidase)
MKIALFYIMIGFSFICVNTQKNLKTVKGEGHKLTKKKKKKKQKKKKQKDQKQKIKKKKEEKQKTK